MEAQDEAFEARLRALEGWRAEKAGEERRLSTLGAGAGGVVGAIRVQNRPPELAGDVPPDGVAPPTCPVAQTPESRKGVAEGMRQPLTPIRLLSRSTTLQTTCRVHAFQGDIRGDMAM